MKKSLTDIHWEELKRLYYEVRCQGISEDKAFDMWSKYQTELIHRIGEEMEEKK